MRYLGIDYGAKRVGIALSDETGTFAFPETTLANDETLSGKIWKLVKERGVTDVVIGASYDYTGKENPIMKDIVRFKERFEKEYEVPMHLESEVLTSAQARRMPKPSDARRSRKPRGKMSVDASAAALIVQSFLDRHKKI